MSYPRNRIFRFDFTFSRYLNSLSHELKFIDTPDALEKIVHHSDLRSGYFANVNIRPYEYRSGVCTISKLRVSNAENNTFAVINHILRARTIHNAVPRSELRVFTIVEPTQQNVYRPHTLSTIALRPSLSWSKVAKAVSSFGRSSGLISTTLSPIAARKSLTTFS